MAKSAVYAETADCDSVRGGFLENLDYYFESFKIDHNDHNDFDHQ